MFLFKCCQSVDSGKAYAVRKKNANNEDVISYVSSISDVNRKDLDDPNIQIFKIEKSEYDQLIKEYKGTEKKWTDPYFQPNQRSLGEIQNVQTSQWKRISDILNKPALFDGKIEPKDVIQGSLGDCYFLSALAALAENQERIKVVFGNQQYSPNGIYKVTLRIDGIIQQILIDDYVPVNKRGDPLFCQPNRNQFWVLILQKAWAKAHGSYANIVSGNPTEVFKAVTYAPAQMHLLKENEEDKQKLWRSILKHAMKDHPCCCGTDDNPLIDWERIKLVAGHAYTLINAAQLTDNNGNNHKMLTLRNPWGNTEWQGEGNEKDTYFWKSIKQSPQKRKFLANFSKQNDGIFFISFHDFCKFFSQTHFCMLQNSGNYISEDLYPNGKNGTIFTFVIQSSSDYAFQIHQDGMRGEDPEKLDDGLNRSTLLIAKEQNNGNGFSFVDGILKYNDEDATLNTYLQPGKYVLYAKLDPTRKRKQLPIKSSVSVYSRQFTDLVPSDQKMFPNFLKKTFLNHAKFNKRQSYNNDQMWISWKLLFQQGGYAYIALGNKQENNKKFIITFDQEQFNSMNFQLKKPFKKKGNQQILTVEPGQQQIILCRVQNTMIKSMKFPPQLNIKMQKVQS